MFNVIFAATCVLCVVSAQMWGGGAPAARAPMSMIRPPVITPNSRGGTLKMLCQANVMANGGQVNDGLADTIPATIQQFIPAGTRLNRQTMGSLAGNSKGWQCLLQQTAKTNPVTGVINVPQTAGVISDYIDSVVELKTFMPFFDPCETVFCGERGMTPLMIVGQIMSHTRRAMALPANLARMFGGQAKNLPFNGQRGGAPMTGGMGAGMTAGMGGGMAAGMTGGMTGGMGGRLAGGAITAPKNPFAAGMSNAGPNNPFGASMPSTGPANNPMGAMMNMLKSMSSMQQPRQQTLPFSTNTNANTGTGSFTKPSPSPVKPFPAFPPSPGSGSPPGTNPSSPSRVPTINLGSLSLSTGPNGNGNAASKPGMNFNGMGMPSTGNTGMGMPSTGNMGMGMPSTANMGMGMSNMGNMGSKPGMNFNGMGMPSTGNMGMGMPSTGNMGMGMPSTGNMGMGMPSTGNMGMGMPGMRSMGSNPGMNFNGMGMPSTGSMGMGMPGMGSMGNMGGAMGNMGGPMGGGRGMGGLMNAMMMGEMMQDAPDYMSRRGGMGGMGSMGGMGGMANMMSGMNPMGGAMGGAMGGNGMMGGQKPFPSPTFPSNPFSAFGQTPFGQSSFGQSPPKTISSGNQQRQSATGGAPSFVDMFRMFG